MTRYPPGVLPISPPDGNDYADHILHDGDALTERHARQLCAVISRAPDEHAEAVADLIWPLWDDRIRQTQPMRRLGEWLREQEETIGLASDTAAEIIEENRREAA